MAVSDLPMEGRSGGLGVVRATSTISLSNPVKRRFIAPLDDVQPTIKVIVTETQQDGCEVSLDKPRKPRKENLAKVVKNPEQPAPAPTFSPQCCSRMLMFTFSARMRP